MNSEFDSFLEAVFDKDYSKLEVLISGGADVNDVGSFGNTALRNAAQSGDGELLEYLISKGCNVNQEINYISPVNGRSEAGYTAMFYSSSVLAVSALLGAGADINKQCKAGYTALMKLCLYSHPEVLPHIKYMLDSGAKVCVNNSQDETVYNALEIAKETLSKNEALFVTSGVKEHEQGIKNSEKIVAMILSYGNV